MSNYSKSKQFKFEDILVKQLNDLSIDTSNNENNWFITKTQKNGSNKTGYKLTSMGYSYTVYKPKLEDVPTAKKVYWKCEKTSSGEKTCSGRGISNGLVPPFTITKKHDHLPAPEKVELLKAFENVKSRAVITNDDPRTIKRDTQLVGSDEVISAMTKKDSIRHLINRHRNNKAGHGFNAKCLKNLEISYNLQFTYKEHKFYWVDSGNDDLDRVIIFTTQSNIDLLNKHHDWYADGTFDIAPTFFKQVYTIHIIISGKTLPMLYALLPNKKQSTHRKLF